MSINDAIERSISATGLLPVSVKLLSCGSSAWLDPTSRASPMRSHTQKTHTAANLAQNQGGRHHARLRRDHATQFTKNRMWRASSCITGTKVSTSSGGKKVERRATANSPKAKK